MSNYDPNKRVGLSEPTFRNELERLINQFSKENGSDTPDFLLADYLCGCLLVYDQTVTAREEWYGRSKRRPEPPAQKEKG